MTQEEIKSEATKAMDDIKTAQQRLEVIRGICRHPVTFEGNWSYGIGSIMPALICSDCFEYIKHTIQ